MELPLMFGRYTRTIFVAILAMVSLAIVYNLPANASLESYEWKDYKTIEGYSGIYGVIDNTGGQSKTEFEQDDKTIFKADGPSDACKGTITIKLDDNSDSKGTLSSEGECSPFQDADRNIVITGQNIAKHLIVQEEDTMIEAYLDRECAGEDQKDKCVNDLKENDIKEKQDTCLAQDDYKTSVAAGDAYLDCMSEALGIPRPGEDQQEEKEEEHCTVPAIGWIVCQMNLFVANLTDYTFDILKPFMTLSPLDSVSKSCPGCDENTNNPPGGNSNDCQTNPDDCVTTAGDSGTHSSTYDAWAKIRTLANVVLVIVFIIIIYSHLTGTGLSVYNIKTMLPRLIIAAVLINASFIICSIAVDASNVVGVTLQDIIKKMDDKPQSLSSEYATWTDVTTKVQNTDATEDPDEAKKDKEKNQANGSENTEEDEEEDNTNNSGDSSKKDAKELDSINLTTLTVGGAEITGIAVMFVQLSALIPIMVMSLFALITVLLVLMLRMAIVIILVILSPLAFACIVLPNTKRWYDRWQSLFVDMMVLFPAISLVFGASALAASVIQASALENGQVLLAIFSMGIQVIPLFVAPLLIKVSGGVLSQFAGIVNNKKKGLYDRSMNRAREFRNDRKAVRQMNAARGKTFFGKVPIPGGANGRLNRMRPINRNAVNKKGRELAEAEAENRLGKFNAENADAINRRALRGINGDVEGIVDEALSGIATSKLEDIETKEVNAAEARFRNDDSITPDQIMDMARTGMASGQKLSEAEQRAAIRLAGRQFNDAPDANGVDGVAKANSLVAMAHDDTGNGGMSINVRRELINTLRESKVADKAAYLGGSSLGKIERGEVYGMDGKDGIDGLVQSAANGGKLSQEALAGSSKTTLELLNKNMGDIKPEAAAQIRTNAVNLKNNPNLNTIIRADARPEIERLLR